MISHHQKQIRQKKKQNSGWCELRSKKKNKTMVGASCVAKDFNNIDQNLLNNDPGMDMDATESFKQ